MLQTKENAINIHEELVKTGNFWLSTSLVHGGQTLCDRLQQLENFRNKGQILITTNVLSRAIDVMQCRIAVNFDLPMNANNTEACYKTFQLRTSRAGRFGTKAMAISLIATFQLFQKYKDIAKYFDFELKKAEI